MGPGVRIAVIRSVLGAAVFFLTFSLSAVAPGRAQSPPPLPGFVPPYEITRIVRTAGFDPLAPPLREGTTYVIRATDFRGILMRVVVDARSGAIRAVNRIVSDQGMYGAVGMLPPPYGAPPPYGGAGSGLRTARIRCSGHSADRGGFRASRSGSCRRSFRRTSSCLRTATAASAPRRALPGAESPTTPSPPPNPLLRPRSPSRHR